MIKICFIAAEVFVLVYMLMTFVTSVISATLNGGHLGGHIFLTSMTAAALVCTCLV